MSDSTDISSQFGQIREVLERMAERLTAIEGDMEQQDFSSKQLVPILQGTRADIVAMRATLLRLANALDLPHEARALHEVGERRKAERRKAG